MTAVRSLSFYSVFLVNCGRLLKELAVGTLTLSASANRNRLAQIFVIFLD